jgi:hypothetical protein
MVEIARISALVASAVHSLHEHGGHLDLKPANVLMREGGGAVLPTSACRMRYSDLLADGQRRRRFLSVVAPEQVVGVRGDPRNDLSRSA